MLLQGFPYIPLKGANRDRQNKKPGSKSLQGKSSDPLVISEWNNAAFQERYLKSFRMRDGTQATFVLQLEVIGKYDRLNTWSMLNRRGEHAYAQLSALQIMFTSHYTTSLYNIR